mmetsp:Transcript_31985/g.83687  ORF Transcript_31985/g.83687 Transcript_31985/m.83687 type:complete len:205 (+) Transcript_31985:1409-2023(+)
MRHGNISLTRTPTAIPCALASVADDMALSCLDRALSVASDESVADVWYNIGQIAIGIGDLGLAYQAFKIAISVDSSHAESYANLGVLELRKGNIDAARSHFRAVQATAPHLFEPFFNGGKHSAKSNSRTTHANLIWMPCLYAFGICYSTCPFPILSQLQYFVVIPGCSPSGVPLLLPWNECCMQRYLPTSWATSRNHMSSHRLR